MPAETPRQILFAEDNIDDATIFQLMFGRATLPGKLHHVEDGQEAINWLSGQGKYADRSRFPIPNILILDIKMPRKTGLEVLEWLRAHQEFQTLPVIVLSSSDDKNDIKRANQLGATNYFVKTARYDDVLQFLRSN